MAVRQTFLGEKKHLEGTERTTIWRISVVRGYLSTIDDGDTPRPFCEIRAFRFLKDKPTPIQKQMIINQLVNSIEGLEDHVFYSVKNTKTEYSDGEDERDISIKEIKDTKNTLIEIDGFELQPVDVDEVMAVLAQDTEDLRGKTASMGLKIDRFRFNYTYNFFLKRDKNGKIIENSIYDDRRIKSIFAESVSAERMQKEILGMK